MTGGTCTGILTALVVSILSGTLAGAQPPNDDFADRIALSGLSGQTTGTNAGAGKESGEPDHAENRGGRSVWWSWQAPRSGSVVFYTQQSDFDTTLAVYRGERVNDLLLAAESDDVGEFLWSLVVVEVVEGREYQIAVDGFDGRAGTIVLTWHLGEAAGGPPRNARFANRQPLEGSAGRLIETNRSSFREFGEPDHANIEGGRSVWWTWVAPEGGVFTLQTNGSSFDTIIAVYTGDAVDALSPVAADDDGGAELASFLAFPVDAGTEYQIAVDGFEGASGVYVLSWLFTSPCGGPDPAARPVPAAGAVDVTTDVLLRWNGDGPLVRRVIYGEDDRRDAYEIDDPELLAVVDSTVALVSRNDLTDNGDGTFALTAPTFGEEFALCPDERFREQPAAAFCSGVLVAPDLVATAGHCAAGFSDCTRTAFLFGYRMLDPETPVMTFPASDVYFCQEIVGSRSVGDGPDWAVVRLDRPVTDRSPVNQRRQGRVGDSQALVVLGYPAGIPVKIDRGGRVWDNSPSSFFFANLDTYVGSSGSPVLNADSLKVEGLLVRGEEDFDVDTSGDCLESRRCSDQPRNGCDGEEVTRAAEFVHLVPASPTPSSYIVFFGNCGALEVLGETREPFWEVSGLEPAAEYCWQVVALGECDETPGPIWSFTTGAGQPGSFLRGDVSADGDRNVTDAVRVLSFLFQGGDVPACLKSADVDDSGEVDITDAIFLLSHLFLGGNEPPEPFASCGTDPTADDLTCAGDTGC